MRGVKGVTNMAEGSNGIASSGGGGGGGGGVGGAAVAPAGVGWEDRDFEVTAEMMLHDVDNERTLDEEEALEGDTDFTSEINDLEKEGEMPLDQLLVLYGYGSTVPLPNAAGNGTDAHEEEGEGEEEGEEGEEREEEEGPTQQQQQPSEKPGGKAGIEAGPSVDGEEPEQEEAEPLQEADGVGEKAEEEAVAAARTGEEGEEMEEEGEETESSADDLVPLAGSAERPDLLTRTLRSRALLGEGDKGSSESEDDEDYMPSDDWKKEIMVGSMYQAEVPTGICRYQDGEKAYEGEDQLLWRPCPLLLDGELEGFLREAARPGGEGDDNGVGGGGEGDGEGGGGDVVGPGGGVGGGGGGGLHAIPEGNHVRDREQALYELMRSDYEARRALAKMRSNERAVKEETGWTEEECRDFENGLRLYGKDFFQIQLNKVRSRTVGECVAFYYMWKKSERHDFFARQHRLSKKKYSLHPGVTDYMDRLLDECEGATCLPSPGPLTLTLRTDALSGPYAFPSLVIKAERQPSPTAGSGRPSGRRGAAAGARTPGAAPNAAAAATAATAAVVDVAAVAAASPRPSTRSATQRHRRARRTGRGDAAVTTAPRRRHHDHRLHQRRRREPQDRHRSYRHRSYRHGSARPRRLDRIAHGRHSRDRRRRRERGRTFGRRLDG
ncbi:mesoderm induction early response protein 1-like isoform X1 [Petromyzon marinus]|uniref:mesoderm induction early response protein 1-like isoform X1 n=1 Tax=Petromyzon marinus TaxID=7757 RepID=UPI003F6E857A